MQSAMSIHYLSFYQPNCLIPINKNSRTADFAFGSFLFFVFDARPDRPNAIFRTPNVTSPSSAPRHAPDLAARFPVSSLPPAQLPSAKNRGGGENRLLFFLRRAEMLKFIGIHAISHTKPESFSVIRQEI